MLEKSSGTDLVWSGIEYDSIEHCHVALENEAIDIDASILGHYQGNIYSVRYAIRTDVEWKVRRVQIHSKINGVEHTMRLESAGDGIWTYNGKREEAFNACYEIDLPLTPFTNTLPINRLGMNLQETRQIKVIYIDLLEHTVLPVFQKYARLSEGAYRYENVPNDFEAVIKVDSSGFVEDYPGLFKRVTILNL